MLRYSLCALLLLAGLPAQAAGIADGIKAAHAPQLSHRAVYKLSLAPRPSPSSQVAGVEGRMVMEWRETCDGYIAEQRIVTNSMDEIGSNSISDISASSWEALDGNKFRFSMRQRLDNELVQEYEGSAEIDAASGAGVASVRKPAPKNIKLPAGIIFPTAHLKAILAAARGNRKTDAHPVFDGASETDYYHVVSSIGALSQRPDRGADAEAGYKAIAGLPWWPVQISYYAVGASEGVPEFEIAFHLYDNGVSSNVLLDYGSFALFGALTLIETFEPPDC